MNDEKSGMTGTNLVSVAFYVVIIGLLMPSLQTESFTISDQFVSFFRRVWIVLTTQSVLSVFAISFYTKNVYDDLRDERDDDSRSIGFLIVAWLLFVLQIALRRCCFISASVLVLGVCSLTVPELISCRRRITGLRFCQHLCHCVELVFNGMYIICGIAFIVQGCPCAIQIACGILMYEIVLEMIIRKHMRTRV